MELLEKKQESNKSNFEELDILDYANSICDQLQFTDKDYFPKSLSQLSSPCFLMNVPLTFRAEEANNIWMEKLSTGQQAVVFSKAFAQFMELYQFIIKKGGLVFFLPNVPGEALQDLVFCANSGIYLEHLPQRNIVIVSNFTSLPRRGETTVIQNALIAQGYNAIVCPYKFEGEADLKYLRDNIYIGGYGMRSELKAYEWMEEKFDMKIIKLKMSNPFLYHLDCSVFCISDQDLLIYTDDYSNKEIALLEQYAQIIAVDLKSVMHGITNCVRVKNYILSGSNEHDNTLSPHAEFYQGECYKNRMLEKICSQFNLTPQYFNLSEYIKGGGLLSCLIMHLNRRY